MTDRIERAAGGAGADSPNHSPDLRHPRPRAKGRPPQSVAEMTIAEALARLEAAAGDAGQDLQYRLEFVDEADMVVVTRRQDAAVLRRMSAAEAIRLATLLHGGNGGLFAGTF